MQLGGHRALSRNYGDFFERYRAALGLECFNTADVETLVAIGRELEREDKNVWEVPVRVADRQPLR